MRRSNLEFWPTPHHELTASDRARAHLIEEQLQKREGLVDVTRCGCRIRKSEVTQHRPEVPTPPARTAAKPRTGKMRSQRKEDQGAARSSRPPGQGELLTAAGLQHADRRLWSVGVVSEKMSQINSKTIPVLFPIPTTHFLCLL